MKIAITALLWILACFASAQDYRSTLQNLYSENKEEDIPPLLAEWEKARPDDPEMYIAWFNFYFNQSRKEIIQLENDPRNTDALTVLDSANEPVGYMYPKIFFDDSLFRLGQKYIDAGIARFPDRLDMYFGKFHALREAGFHEEHVQGILNIISLYCENKSGWRWSNNEAIINPEIMFKGAIQDYSHALFNLEVPYTEGIERISLKMLTCYPQSVESISNLGVCHLIKKEYSGALDRFLKASSIDPNDVIVLINIAYTYRLMGNKKNAIRFYEKVAQSKSAEHAEFAKDQIKELK